VIVPLPLPDYTPDLDSTGGGLNTAENTYRSADGYHPLKAVAAISNALPGPFRGGGAFIGGAGIAVLLVGTDTGLYQYAAGAWTSLLTGLTVTGKWRFTQFGNDVVSVNGAVTYKTTLTGTVASTAISGAPAGVCVAVVGDYVVIGQAASDLIGIYTSDFNSDTGWNPAGAGATATTQPMLTGGEVMGLAGGEYGIILQRQRLVRMDRTGDSLAPFAYNEISPNFGCACKASIAAVGHDVFFLSDRGFMALANGQQLRPIGSEKVDRTFRSLVPRDDYERMFCAVDPESKLVMWCIPGSPGTLWIYNFELNNWTTGSLAVDGIFAGFASSLTLEQVAAIYTNLDTMPYSLDDPRFAGGAPRLYAVQAGAVGTFTGATLQTTFEGSFLQLTETRRTRLMNVRPITDAASGMTLAVDARERLGDAPNVRTVTALRASGNMPLRHSGRFVKPTLTYAAGTAWSIIESMEFECSAGGVR
jgi:hypothetical protein